VVLFVPLSRGGPVLVATIARPASTAPSPSETRRKTMRIASGNMVALGYGKYVRSDRVAGLAPIEEGRGPGQRTWVYLDDIPEPFIASRSDGAILRDLVDPGQEAHRGREQRQLLEDILDTIDRLDPVIRRIIRDQAQWDLDRLEERIRDGLGDG
jgi:hypothetical protein